MTPALTDLPLTDLPLLHVTETPTPAINKTLSSTLNDWLICVTNCWIIVLSQYFPSFLRYSLHTPSPSVNLPRQCNVRLKANMARLQVIGQYRAFFPNYPIDVTTLTRWVGLLVCVISNTPYLVHSLMSGNTSDGICFTFQVTTHMRDDLHSVDMWTSAYFD